MRRLQKRTHLLTFGGKESSAAKPASEKTTGKPRMDAI
jgi:hypothetical protein